MNTANGLEWAQALSRFDKAQTFQGLTPRVRRLRAGHLEMLAARLSMSPAEVTTRDLETYLAARGIQPGTRRNYVKSWRAFWRWLYESGYSPMNPALDLPLTLNSEQEAHEKRKARQIDETPRRGPEPLEVPEPWASWLIEWRRYQRVAGVPETTIETRLYHLRQAARALDPVGPAEVTLDDLLDWLIETSWSNETRRSVRSTLRSFFAWSAETGRVDDDPAARLPKVRASIAVPRPATESAYRFALTVAQPRERLMLRLAAELGLRRAEVAQVHTRDVIDLDEGKSLVVQGKGDKQRILPLSRSLAAEMEHYPPGWIFPSSSTAGHLRPATVSRLIRPLLPEGTTMHGLRHRFATVAYSTSRDLLTVQKVLGHSSPATTQRYVSLSDDTARSLIDQIEAGSRTVGRTSRLD